MAEPAKTAYIFPGQGSQTVGMGRDLFDNFEQARTIFKQADESVSFPLSKLCFEGPEEELRQTINAQPALLTVSIACLKCAEKELPPPAFLAGHSLGEYTALAAANVLNFADAVYLARERGRLMHEAGQARPGGMVAVLGLDENILSEVCRETNTNIANFNCPGQLVISGAKENIDRAMELAKAKGASRCVPLAVSGAFHSPLMQPAADGLSKIISTLKFNDPTIPIIANATAKPMTTADQIKTELLTQLCSPVQWQRSIEFMINNGVSNFIEIGSGKVLSGLIKRINKDVTISNIGDVETIRRLKSNGPH
ncbi:MAG: ACP S-malonyltransferase [Chloroflexota bacterium]